MKIAGLLKFILHVSGIVFIPTFGYKVSMDIIPLLTSMPTIVLGIVFVLIAAQSLFLMYAALIGYINHLGINVQSIAIAAEPDEKKKEQKSHIMLGIYIVLLVIAYICFSLYSSVIYQGNMFYKYIYIVLAIDSSYMLLRFFKTSIDNANNDIK